jgi:hypothetical protein
MKYVANPVVVDAYKILMLEGISDGGYELQLDNFEFRNATPAMCSRMTPAVGDYWVVQADGYTYLNPKDVFERKYRPTDAAGLPAVEDQPK